MDISEFTLHGRDYRYIAALIAGLESKRKNDLPLVAYRQLTLEPYKDKEKAAVLRFIATNYTDT